ncbi:MAG: hypothetical protein WBF84_00940 [Castellaniella sp.]|uniref:hypothetical protein n=1 Tax=Castellaniella sp. TaxID=1955812 RepID=UPI003C77B4EC
MKYGIRGRKNKFPLDVKKIHSRRSGISGVSAVIGFFGGILTVIVGQWMSAQTEINGVIRPKLEDAYNQVLMLPLLAKDFHSTAFVDVASSNFYFFESRYEQARGKYVEAIGRVVAISDLYEPEISFAAQKMAFCGQDFVSMVASQFLLSAKSGGMEVLFSEKNQRSDPKLILRESLMSVVDQRNLCEATGEELRKIIVKAMKSRL